MSFSFYLIKQHVEPLDQFRTLEVQDDPSSAVALLMRPDANQWTLTHPARTDAVVVVLDHHDALVSRWLAHAVSARMLATREMCVRKMCSSPLLRKQNTSTSLSP